MSYMVSHHVAIRLVSGLGPQLRPCHECRGVMAAVLVAFLEVAVAASYTPDNLVSVARGIVFVKN
ncbi:hypothetical protein J6590_080946 [Homalodisca vitripennis]|nr:hypothetical protein J6590_080946 [Homalodisca vitripennis]